MKRLILIDGSALAYRSYFAFIGNPLINSKGENTSAVFGFTNSLLKLQREQSFDYWVVVFDTRTPTFRHRLYGDYKATRQKMPDEMRDQLPRIGQVIEALQVPRLEVEGYEADDVIGTLAKAHSQQGWEVIIFSGDKDFMQLVGKNILILNPRSKEDEGLTDAAKVKAKFGVGPEQVVDVLGLMGDTSDNVPGVPGVGEKTAISLVQEYGSIDRLLKKVDTIKRAKLQEKIKEHREQLLLSRQLVTIDTSVPLDCTIESFRVQEADQARCLALFKELEFTNLVKAFSSGSAGPAANYHTVGDIKEWQELLKKAEKQKSCVIDLETTALDPLQAGLVGIALALEEGTAFYAAVGHTVEPEKNLDLKAVLAPLKDVLEDTDIAVSGQNIKYDLQVLSRYGIDIRNIAFDTMVASYVINPSQRQHNLDALSLEYLNHRMISYDDLLGGKGKRDKKTIAEVPVVQVATYAGEDADMTLRLKNIFEHKLEEMGLKPLFKDVEMPLIQVLARMERNGVALDIPFLKKMSVRIDQELDSLTKAIHQLAGEEFNINSTQQLGAILFEKLKLPKKKKTKTGYSTDVEVLEALAMDHELPRRLLDYRTLAKLKNTYVDALVNLVNPQTKRVHTSFNQTVTTTGRLSSSDPNLQNIPIRTELGREIRKALVPGSKQAVILAADYSQIELRIMAHLSQDTTLIQSFEKQEDIHTRTAALVFNLFPEMVTPELRRRAKAINFGIMYGMGAFGLSRELGIPVKEANAFIQGYFQQYPAVQRFIARTIEEARKNGYVTTLRGRIRYVPEINSPNRRLAEFAERTAVNTPIQGTAADMIKMAMLDIDQAMQHKKLASKMILQVHDELVFEVPKKELATMKKLVKEKMEKALPLSVPIVVDVKEGKNWFEAH